MNLTFVFDGYLAEEIEPALFVFDGYLFYGVVPPPPVPPQPIAGQFVGGSSDDRIRYRKNEDEIIEDEKRQRILREDDEIIEVIKTFLRWQQ